MIVALCVDDKNGLSFGGRRQSRDKILVKDFMNICAGKAKIASYSSFIFKGYDVIVDDFLLENAGNGEYVFIENKNIEPYCEKIEKFIIYKWNRNYPADMMFTMPDGFVLSEVYEFKGSSHENITREIYIRG